MGIRPASCSVCRHPQRILIDQTIVRGSESLRGIAKRVGLSHAAVTRHAANHLQLAGTATPGTVAGEIVQAVREQREREQGEVARLWDQRLHETYDSVRRGIQRAEQDPEHWVQVAKFAQAAGSLIDTGLRSCGVLAGGVEGRVTVNVEQVVLLPQPEGMRQLPKTIDVVESKDEIDG